MSYHDTTTEPLDQFLNYEAYLKSLNKVSSDCTNSDGIFENAFEGNEELIQDEPTRKESGVKRLLHEIEKDWSRNHVEKLENDLEDAQNQIENLKNQLKDLEDALETERNYNVKYLKAMETLETEIERLQEENKTLHKKNTLLGEKLYLAELQIQMAKKETIIEKQESNVSLLLIGKCASNNNNNRVRLRSKKHFPRYSEDKENENIFQERQVPDCSTSPEKNKKLGFDDILIKKIKFLKEKLLCEEDKCRNLEFLLATQEELIMTSNQTICNLKEKTKLLEAENEKMKLEIDHLNEVKLQDKTKIDNAITFCDLFNNFAFSKEECQGKLAEFPSIMSSLLKHNSPQVIGENHDFAASPPSSPIIKKPKSFSEYMENSFDGSQAKNDREVVKEIEDLKKSLNDMTQVLSQAFPTADQSVLTSLGNISQHHLNLKEELSNGNTILNPHLGPCRKSKCGLKTEQLLTKAIQNSSSLFWNLRLNQRLSKNNKDSVSNDPAKMRLLTE